MTTTTTIRIDSPRVVVARAMAAYGPRLTAADELLVPGGEVRADDGAARWAWYRIGAFMAPTDTGKVHGPETQR